MMAFCRCTWLTPICLEVKTVCLIMQFLCVLGLGFTSLTSGVSFAMVEEKPRTHTSLSPKNTPGVVISADLLWMHSDTHRGLLITSCPRSPSLWPLLAQVWHLPTALPMTSCFSCEGACRGVLGAMEWPLSTDSETPRLNYVQER